MSSPSHNNRLLSNPLGQKYSPFITADEESTLILSDEWERMTRDNTRGSIFKILPHLKSLIYRFTADGRQIHLVSWTYDHNPDAQYKLRAIRKLHKYFEVFTATANAAGIRYPVVSITAVK